MNSETFINEINKSPLTKGQDYPSLKALKLAVHSWTMKEVFEFKTSRSGTKRWEVVCEGENCPWQIYATSIGGAGNIFCIKKYI
jgi:MuDR family transposase